VACADIPPIRSVCNEIAQRDNVELLRNPLAARSVVAVRYKLSAVCAVPALIRA